MSLTKTQRKKDKKGKQIVADSCVPQLDLPYELIGEIYAHIDEDALRTLAQTGSVGRDIALQIVNARHAKIFGASRASYNHKLRDIALYNLVGGFIKHSARLPDTILCVLELQFDDSKLSFTAGKGCVHGKVHVIADQALRECKLERQDIMDAITQHQEESESPIVNVKLILYNMLTGTRTPV
jgi:hypothetical protein